METSPTAIVAAVARCRAAARRAGHRLPAVLAGSAAWGRERAIMLAEHAGETLWIGEAAPAGIPATDAGRVRGWLGREQDCLVFDAHTGFDPDALGAAAGLPRAGGMLILLIPPLAQWPGSTDPAAERIAVHPFTAETVTGRFLARAARLLGEADDCLLAQQDGRLRLPRAPRARPAETGPPGDDPCRTADQRHAVEAIKALCTEADPAPLVLTADRGRGKSAALGIACGELADRPLQIRVTAPRKPAAATLFAHAAERLGSDRPGVHPIHSGGLQLAFEPPDALVADRPPADLLLVDEAAAIPAPLLEAMAAHYPRVVFATTQHGYEGTGRGFAVRFQATLDRHHPGWQHLELVTPIRWSRGDPLEALVFRLLLLDAEPGPADRLPPADRLAPPEWLDRDRLLDDEGRLRSLFGLLVLAHYRTTPLDLRNLLDGPGISVLASTSGEAVAGTALLSREGGLDDELLAAIFEGRRRPRGHLLPQTLSAHGGLARWPALVGLRIMRIAVHPGRRHRGIGQRLVNRATQRAESEGLDFVGASFGATPGLLAFWCRCGLVPIHIGLSRGQSSGTHALVMARGTSERGRAEVAVAQRRFRRRLAALLGGPLTRLDPVLAAALLEAPHPSPAALDRHDRQELDACAHGHHGLDAALPTIQAFLDGALADPAIVGNLERGERALLVARFLQHRDWPQLRQCFALQGRREGTEHLRRLLARCLDPPRG